MNEELVTISKKRLLELIKSEYKIMALESGGVDNWEWYGDSLNEYDYYSKEDKDWEELLNKELSKN